MFVEQSSKLQSFISRPSPEQSAPPCAGSGSVQDLFLVCVPPPQPALQGLQPAQAAQPPSTGQLAVPQDWVSVWRPGQTRPPCAGAGALQVRLLLCSPPPQVWEQELQVPQPAQPPSTEHTTNTRR